MINGIGQFLRGIVVPFKGAKRIFSSPKLMVYALFPFWLCFFGFIYMVSQFWGSFPQILPYIMQWVPGLFSFTEGLKIGEFSLLSAVMQGMFWVFLVVFASYFSYIGLAVIGSPLYALLAENILRNKGARPSNSGGFFHWIYTLIKMLLISFLKLAFFAVIGLCLFFFSFLPVGMIIVPFLMALMISYDCFDFSFECMNMSIKQRYRFFKRHIFAFYGLGLMIILVGSVPGLFVLTLPFFIAGCADLFADFHMRELK